MIGKKGQEEKEMRSSGKWLSMSVSIHAEATVTAPQIGIGD
jgi:hypothetical protein